MNSGNMLPEREFSMSKQETGFSFTTEMEIKNTHEFGVLATNEKKRVITLLTPLSDLIAHKMKLKPELVKIYIYQELWSNNQQ